MNIASRARRRPPVPAPTPSRSAAPAGARHWVLLVLDSCRFDAFATAKTPHLRALGEVQRRWAYATWTAPSHYNLLMGLMPHSAPPGTHSADVYREEFQHYRDRLGVDIDLGALAPKLWLPALLKTRGWRTGAYVSMPVLNEQTPLAVGFDKYELRERHNDLRGIVDDLRFYTDAPSFWLINTGETHYPYAVHGILSPELPRLSGFNGAIRRLSDSAEPPAMFDSAQLADLQQRQITALEHVDSVIAILRATVPENTWLTVTADHGECFGEDGYFGHGPIHHPKVLEVPFIEGRLR